VKLWKDNKTANGWELPDEEVAARFLASKFNDLNEYPWWLDRALPVFIGAKETDGGLQSAFVTDTPEAMASYENVVRMIVNARNAESAAAQQPTTKGD
jgi:hypothetical protein